MGLSENAGVHLSVGHQVDLVAMAGVGVSL